MKNNEKAKTTQKPGKLFVISAPTGAGKTTIINQALQQLPPSSFTRVVTWTTRPPRPGEQQDVDYHFLSEKEFIQKEAVGFFLETSCYADNRYGSPMTTIDQIKQGISFFLITDRAGALGIKKIYPPAILIWIDVPSEQDLYNRLQNRNGSAKEIEKRFKIAKQEREIEQKEQKFDYHLMNDKLEQAVNDFVWIIKK